MIPAILADFIFDVMIAENIADCAVRLNDDAAILVFQLCVWVFIWGANVS